MVATSTHIGLVHLGDGTLPGPDVVVRQDGSLGEVTAVVTEVTKLVNVAMKATTVGSPPRKRTGSAELPRPPSNKRPPRPR